MDVQQESFVCMCVCIYQIFGLRPDEADLENSKGKGIITKAI